MARLTMCSLSHSYNDVPEMPATDAGATSDNKDLGEFASRPVLQCDLLTPPLCAAAFMGYTYRRFERNADHL